MKQSQVKTKLKHTCRKYGLALVFCLILTTIYYCFTFPSIQTIFHYSEGQSFQFYLYIAVGFVLLNSFFFAIYYFFKNYREHKTFIKYFLIYFAIMCVFLFLGWPGIFRGDEHYTIPIVTNMGFVFEQHYFTNLFYAISLAIIPTLGGITFIQIIIISLIVAYILSHIEKVLHHPKLTYLLFIVLLLPPIIDANLFTLRSTLTAYLFLLSICHLILYDKNHNPRHLFYLGLICCIVANWKSEFIYLPVFVIIYLLIFYRKKLQLKKFFSFIIIFVAIFYLLRIPQQQNSHHYLATTIVFNPLSIMMVHPEIEASLSETDRANIEAVIPISQLQKYSTYQNTIFPTEEYTDAEEKALFRTFLKLVLSHPSLFLDTKFKTYAATNFPSSTERVNHTGYEDPASQWNLSLAGKTYLRDNFPYIENPFGENFKKGFVSFLQLRDENYQITPAAHFFYNTSIPIILSILLSIAAIFRKHWKLLCILIIELAQFPIIFLSAPANFWMYYFCLYLLLYFTIFSVAIFYLDRKLSISHQAPNEICYNNENQKQRSEK